MSRKRKGLPINGWIIVDKPVGIGSTSVVSIIKRLTQAQKVGHGGTLDPGASGVLPIALGEATKTISYVMDGVKTYRFTVKFGEATDTDDAEGKVITTSDVRPTAEQIQAVLPGFIGEIEQVPPKYSAIHVDGKRAYDLAREDKDIELAPRRIRIDELTFLDNFDGESASFEVTCGKGTYVRSIARDLAEKLNSVGHVTVLRRVRCGKFFVENAFSLEYLRSVEHILNRSDILLPVETVLDDIPALALTAKEALLLSNGGFLSAAQFGVSDRDGQTLQAKTDGRLVALARIQDGMIRPIRVIVQ